MLAESIHCLACAVQQWHSPLFGSAFSKPDKGFVPPPVSMPDFKPTADAGIPCMPVAAALLGAVAR